MAFPDPKPGLVIRYSYLWRREHVAGQEEGEKDRPCAIVAAIRTEQGDTRVLVLPITHSTPESGSVAIEIPKPIKANLGLDELRSWIVVSEYNEFVWPGPDLRPVSGSADGSIVYGFLTPGLFETVRKVLLEHIRSGRAKAVRRTE